MAMIRIRHQDDDDEAYARHKQIEEKLEEHGADAVRAMLGHGFPTEWNPIIIAWLKGDRLGPKPEKKAADGDREGRPEA